MSKKSKSCVFAVAALLCVATLHAQTPPPLGARINMFTNSVPTGAVTNNGSKRPIDIPGSSVIVFGIGLRGASAAAGTSNVVASFNASLDGTRWTTDFPYSITAAANGTNATYAIVTIGTNIPARFLSLDRFTTDAGTNVTVSDVVPLFLPSR